MVERKEIVGRAERTVSRMLGEGDQHAADAILKLLEELVEETEAADNWRRLALQFDNHRMQALGHLKAVVNPGTVFDAYKAAKAFLNAPPLDGEEVLAQRIAELAATSATVDMGIPMSESDAQVVLPESVPSGMCLVNAGALQMVINALRRDAEEGKVVRGEMADELLASVEQAQADALDAARYRFLRDTCWSSDKELATVISLQMNKIWDEKIDEAMARNKKE